MTQIYPRPSYVQRLKIAFHYLLPQLTITQAAGWLAKKEWGAITHALINVFIRIFKVDLSEA